MPTHPARPAAGLPDPERAELEQLACALAVGAGRLIVQDRPAALTVAATKTSVLDVVTVMDRRSEDLLRERIAVARPGDAVLGEEEGTRPGSTGITWVVDPIDGTVNYLYGIPAYCVSVAAVTGDPQTPGRWQPVAGAVFNPVLDELVHARLGGGAHLSTGSAPSVSLRRLRAAEPAGLDRALVATGFHYRLEVREGQGQVAARMLQRVRDLRRGGSAALDLCAVALGRVDAYYEAGLHPWDLAAGLLVVTEAGGTVTGLDGGAPSEAMVVAGAPAVQADLLTALRECGA